MSPFTEVETVYREVGGVRFAVLGKKNITECVGVLQKELVNALKLEFVFEVHLRLKNT